MLKADGTPLASFNGGQPVQVARLRQRARRARPSYAQVAPAARGPAHAGDRRHRRRPRAGDRGHGAASTCTPGTPTAASSPGFPVRIDPARSAPALRTRENHIKRGFIASPTLGDLTGGPALEIVAPSLDQHVYAWNGQGQAAARLPEQADSTRRRPGPRSSPRRRGEHRRRRAPGDRRADAEFDPNPAAPRHAHRPVRPRRRVPRRRSPTSSPTPWAAAAAPTPLGAGGAVLRGWPIVPNGVVPDALPLVGPGGGPGARERGRRPAARGDRQRGDR